VPPLDKLGNRIDEAYEKTLQGTVIMSARDGFCGRKFLKKMKITKSVITIVFIFISVPLFSKTIYIDSTLKKIPTGHYIEYLEDTQGTFSLDEIRMKKNEGLWKSSHKETLGFGFTATVYWIRITVANTSNTAIDFYLEQAYPLIHHFSLYMPENGSFRKIDIGSMMPFGGRIIDHRNLVFPLTLKEKSPATYYLRYQTGSPMIIQLNIWSPSMFANSEIIEYRALFIFYSILFIMALYNFIMFLFIRRIEYLYFVLVIACVNLLFMSLEGTACQYLWPNHPGLTFFAIPFLMSILSAVLLLFVMESTDLREIKKKNKLLTAIYKIYIWFMPIIIITILFSLILPYRIASPIASAVIMITLILICISVVLIIVIEKSRVAAIIAISGFFGALGGILFILKTFGILQATLLTEWSMHIGMVIMLILFSISLADRINIMGREIVKAEKKYRGLVESSDDIIFSLDTNLNILSVNRAMTKHLGFKEKDVIGRNFLVLIEESRMEERQISKIIIKEYFDGLLRTGKSVSFRADFKSDNFNEPMELSVKVEYVAEEGEQGIIMGKASQITDDIILQYLESERHVYRMDNYLVNAELLSQRLVRNLGRFLDSENVLMIRLALREILINAIEHGNLNIKFEEKTQAMESGDYLNMIQERQKDHAFRKRKIFIDYLLKSEKLVYRVTDEGMGFDHARLTDLSEKAEKEMLFHGRGILMTTATFDEVTYNKKGNQVLLVKYFNAAAKNRLSPPSA
jgi:PAS domain-containing protein